MNSSLLQLQSSLFGLLPQDTFNQKPWRILKNTLRSTSQQNILLPECQKFLSLLKDLNTCSSLEEYFGDSSIKKFFLSVLIPANIKSFLRCNDIESPQIEGIFNDCLRHVILLWVKTLPEDDLALRKIVEHILNPKLSYYHRKSSYKPSQAKNFNNDVNEDDVVDSTKPVITTSFAEFIESLKQDKRLTSHIYEIISNKESLTSSLRMMTLTCFIANHFNFTFPKDVMVESISQIRQIIWDSLFQHGESYIEDLTEKSITDVLQAYNLLLRRLSYSVQDKHREIDLLQLQISMIHLKSLTKDKKLIGLRILNRVIGELENPSSSQLKLKSQPACNEALRTIFCEVYRCKFPWKRNLGESLKLFEYMVRHKLLSSDNSKALKVALHLLGQNRKPEIVDFLKKAKENDQLDLFVNCLISENLSNLQALQIQDMLVLYRIYKVSRYVYGKVIKFLREVLAKSDTISNFKVVEFAFFRHKKMMFSNGSGTLVFTAFTDSIDEVQKDITKFSCFRIIQLFILDVMRRFVIDERRGISEILNEKEVLKLFVDHIKSFKAYIQQKGLSNKKGELPYLTQISMRIDCLKQLFRYGTFTLLNELWELLVNQAFIPSERELFFKMLSEEIPNMNSKFIPRFFQAKIITQETQAYLQASKEGALYFKAFFVALNQSLDRIEAPKSSNFSLKVPPEELKGFNELWEFIMSSKDPEATQEIINLLMKIYSACEDQFEADLLSIREKELARCFKYLKEALANEKTQSFENESKDRCIKCLKIISAMIDASEIRGIGHMNTHSKLLKGAQLQIHVDLYGYFGYKRGQVDLTIDSNSTVFELLRETAKRFGVGWDEILLSKSKNPQDQNKILNQYGRTLSELGMKSHENLKALTQEIPKINLLTPENTLHPRVSKAFCGIFEQFSENNKMSPENLASFINACTGDCPNANHDGRTGATFSSFDTDRDGYMTEDDFLRFYCQAAMNKPHIVWDNLNKFKKVRNDLKDVEEVNNEKADKQILVSSLINSNSTQFDLLFSLLDQEESIALEAWTLLNRLPTNPKTFEDMVLMKEIRGIADPEKRDWNAVLNMNSKYQLLYALNVIEYLFHFSQDGVNTILLSDNTDILESQKTWKTDFINSGGLNHLCGIFSVFNPSESTVLITPYKRVLSFVNAINSKLKLADSVSLEQEQYRKSEIMEFMKLSAKYQHDYITMEQVVAANFMRKSIKNLKNRRKV